MAGMASTSGAAALGLARMLGPKLAFGAIAALALAWGAQPARAGYTFQDIINSNDPTFNQELGINSAGMIAGYFGAGNGLARIIHEGLAAAQ